MIESTNQRLSWRLTELPAVTGLGLPFWRKWARLGRVKTRKVMGAVVVLDQDLRAFLEGESENSNAQAPANDSKAVN